MAVIFNDATRELLDGRNFGTVATVNPDGSPQASVVWVKRDGDTVLFSTTAARRKARNISRDPRVSVVITESGNPYNYVEIRGRAEMVRDEDRSLPNELSNKYRGEDFPADPPGVVRMVVRVIPATVSGYAA